MKTIVGRKFLWLILFLFLASCQRSEDPEDLPRSNYYASTPLENAPFLCDDLVEQLGAQQAYSSCLEQAQAGNVHAQARLGALYAKGELGAINWDQATHWFLLAAQQNHPEAQYVLAQSYYLGRSVEKNDQIAFSWAQKSAQAGFAAGEALLGQYYLAGIGVSRDLPSALKWLEQSAQKKYASAQYELALAYLNEASLPKDLNKIEDLLQKASLREPLALITLGELYAQGLKGNPEPALASHWYYKAMRTEHPQVLTQLAEKLLKAEWQASIDPIALLEKAAKQSYAPAQVILADLYHHHEKYQDFSLAFKYYLALAKQNEPHAMHQLGMAYLVGDLNQAVDLNIAVQYLKQAATLHHYPAQYVLASLFLEGHPVLNSRLQAIDYLQQAARNDYPDAQVKMAKLFSEFSLPQYDKVAFYWAQKAAAQQHPEAMRLLANFYYEGIGVPTDYLKAFESYLPLAQQADPQAQLRLGQMYYYGQGVKSDPLHAMQWLLAASRAGESTAQTLAATCFKNHFTAEMLEQEPLAREWILYAADQGDVHALYLKGKHHLYGKGNFEQDPQLGISILQRAAQKNSLLAKKELAKLYEQGLFGLADPQQALYWYMQAAQQGDEGSQYHLATLYYSGETIEKNYLLSYVWASLSAKQKNLQAKTLQQQLTDVLNEKELAYAQQLSQQFEHAHHQEKQP